MCQSLCVLRYYYYHQYIKDSSVKRRCHYLQKPLSVKKRKFKFYPWKMTLLLKLGIPGCKSQFQTSGDDSKQWYVTSLAFELQTPTRKYIKFESIHRSALIEIDSPRRIEWRFSNSAKQLLPDIMILNMCVAGKTNVYMSAGFMRCVPLGNSSKSTLGYLPIFNIHTWRLFEKDIMDKAIFTFKSIKQIKCSHMRVFIGRNFCK